MISVVEVFFMQQSIVNMIWIGEKVSPIEALCMKSFIYNGMHVKLSVYNLVGGVPQDVELCDANLIIPQKNIFKHKGSYAAFADLFRWKLMYEYGGYYSDTDVICLKKFDFETDVVIGWEEENRLLTPTILGFEQPRHRLAKQLLYNALHPLESRPYDSFRIRKKKFLKRFLPFKVNAVGWGETAGPRVLTKEYFFEQNHYNVLPLSCDTFYKVPYGKWRTLVEPNGIDLIELMKESYAVHLWNEMWRQHNIDKYGLFRKESFIRQAMEWYC